jgi:cell division protein FtsL
MESEKIIQNTILVMADFMNKTDKINQRLTTLCKVLALCIVLTAMVLAAAICYKDYAYFYSDYQYPQVEQQSTQTGDSQEVKQNIN